MNDIENTSVTYVVSTMLICHYCVVKESAKKFDSIFLYIFFSSQATCYVTQIIDESDTLGTAENAIFSCGC